MRQERYPIEWLRETVVDSHLDTDEPVRSLPIVVRMTMGTQSLAHRSWYSDRPSLLGDSFEVVARIQRPGSWVLMCMFPYHMRLGMMGMVMTEGASMEIADDMEMWRSAKQDALMSYVAPEPDEPGFPK